VAWAASICQAPGLYWKHTAACPTGDVQAYCIKILLLLKVDTYSSSA